MSSTTPLSNQVAGAAGSRTLAHLAETLRIRVSVVVTLVSGSQSVEDLLQVGPGSILQFDKACTDPLTLEISGRTVAVGEVVKVGDKFGLRIIAVKKRSR